MKIQPCFSLISSLILLAIYQSLVLAEADSFNRDYEFSKPLPQTGRVTIRQPIQELPTNRLFADCPKGTHLTDFAESTHFLVMICRDYSNELKKHWIQKTKETGKVIQATAQDHPSSQPVGWIVGNDDVYIYIDSRMPEKSNAYIEFYNRKTREGWAEALLYHYSKVYDYIDRMN